VCSFKLVSSDVEYNSIFAEDNEFILARETPPPPLPPPPPPPAWPPASPKEALFPTHMAVIALR
jgi:hypothetical protein